MCGRYILAQKAKFERAIKLQRIRWEFTASYNVAPTQEVPIVRLAGGEWEGTMMRWGLIPFWAHGTAPKYSTINATIERFETAPAFRGPWSRGQRCIVPAAGFYEWQVGADGSKQPFLIQIADQEVFGFAGLWERSVAPDGRAVESCTLLTTPANELMSRIHNVRQRMPAILAAADHEAWLSGTAQQAKDTLRPYPDGLMVAYPVSVRVNSPRNNDPSLIDPVDRPPTTELPF